jgi:8-oxo-dGTP diphosphatase
VDRAWQVLLVEQGEQDHALPGVLVGPEEIFDGAARRALAVKAGLDARDWYLEQLATFGNPARDSRARVASVAHTALVRSDDLHLNAVDARPWWCPVNEIPWDALAYDHGAMLREAINRVKGKVRYAWVLFQLLPPVFTISELRAAYAAVRDPEVMRLNTSNVLKLFKGLLEKGILAPVGERAPAKGRGRPGELYRFNGPLNGTWPRELPW